MPRGRKPKRDYHPTVGGLKLRELRQAAGWAQMTLAAEANIDTTHLHKIEVGDIKRPDYETLAALLAALPVGFAERREVMEAFGYRAQYQLPTEEEIEQARKMCAHELHDVTWPVYLMDDSHRLLDWNRYMPRLVGLHPDDPAVEQFRGVTIIDIAFNPAYPTSRLIDNPDEFLPMFVGFIKIGLRPFRDEAWYHDLIGRARQLPRFAALWESIPEPDAKWAVTQPIIPLRINVPGVGPMQFRLSTAQFVLDRRFQFVHYTPHDATAMRQCAVWAEEGAK